MAEAPSSPLLALEKLRDQLTCPVCLDQYDNPKTLPCLHSFCLKCIQQLPLKLEGDKKLIDCPTCRTEANLSNNGIESLPSAFIINNLLEIQYILKKVSMKQQVFCDNCDEQQDASGYCKQCQTWLCEGCVTQHKKWKGFSSHEVLSIKDVASTASQLLPLKEEVMSCINHNEPLKVYCETCQALICRDCTISTHRDHSYHLVSEVFPKHLEEIELILLSLMEKLSATTANITAIGTRESEIKDHEEALRKDIDSYVQSLIELLRASQQEMVERMHTIVEKKLKLLAQQKKEAEIALEQLQSCAEYVEQCLQHGSHQQVLQRKVKMVDRMNQMNEQTDPGDFEPQEKSNILFSKNGVLQEKCKSIGFLTLGSLSSLVPCPPKHAMVGVPTTAEILLKHDQDFEQSLLADTPPPPTCHVTSLETNHTILCDVVEVKDDKIVVSLTPSFSGSHELKVNQDVVGTEYVGPFHVMHSPLTRRDVKIATDLSKPMGVAINNDVIAVVEGGAHCVTLIDREGKRTSFGSKGTGDGLLNNPRGIAFTSDGHVLVTDNHRLQKFTSSGQHLMSFGSKKKGSGPQQLNTPMGIAVHPTTGEIYIADCCNHRIQVVNNDFTQPRSFGGKGSSSGKFKNPTDLYFSSEGVLYIVDSGNHCIEVHLGESISLFIGYRDNGDSGYYGTSTGKLNNPHSLVVDPHDNIYVTETHSSFEMLNTFEDSRISCYTTDGDFVAHIGRRGDHEGDFDNPSGIAMDKLGNLYISDTNNDRLVIM